MKKYLLFAFITFISVSIQAQHIKFEEYNLDNGLHVILHKDNTAPVVAVSVSYRVGSKNEDSTRIGFTHFLEHLLFEESKSINREKYFKSIEKNRGNNNLNTNIDRTYHYETFPSNKLEKGIWLESQRMMLAKIDSIEVDSQSKIVKDKKSINCNNQGYRSFLGETAKHMYKTHPYKWTTVESIDYLNDVQLDEFINFYHTYYVPNNAVLTIAGDFNIEETKAWVKDYFGSIARGKKEIIRQNIKEPFLTAQIVDTIYDSSILIPAVLVTYRTPKQTDRDAYVINLINDILSNGTSSIIYKQIVEKDQLAKQSASFITAGEDYSTLTFFGLLAKGKNMDNLLEAIDKEIDKMRNSFISKEKYDKEMNQLELNFISKNRKMEGVAESLSNYYLFFNNTKLINTEIDLYRSITIKDIKRVANKYLKKERRVVLYYYPKK